MGRFKVVLTLLAFSLMMAACEKELVKSFSPTVNVNSDTTIRLNNLLSDSIQLEGSATDTDGEVVAFFWSQVSGPNAAQIHTPGAAATFVTGLRPGTYVFQLMATDNDGLTGVGTVTATIIAPQIQVLTLQPTPEEGQDAIVAMRSMDGGANANGNHSYIPELNMGRWTYDAQGWGEGTNRSYIKFTGLSAIPANATIKSAKLSLYGVSETPVSMAAPQGNSSYPGSSTNENSSWIKRVIGGNWDEATITWSNMPATTEVNKVALAASTSRWNYDVLNLDVTELVKDIHASRQNYGFCLQLQNEQIYRTLMFSSSEAANPAKRPKLVVEYQ